MSDAQDPVEQLRRLRDSYAEQLPSRLALLRQNFAACQPHGDRHHPDPGSHPQDPDPLQTLRYVAHGLAGSGATFGFPKVSDFARQLELLAAGALEAGRPLDEAECETIAVLLEGLEQAGNSPTARLAALEMPARPAAAIDRRLVYLVEDDIESAHELALQLGHFGYRVRTFATPVELADSIADPALAAILMDVMFPQGDLAGAEAILELTAAKRLQAPVVFLSVRDDLVARLATVRAGCAAYVVKPVDVRALVGTLDSLVSGEQPKPDRVLIVDDTRQLAEHYSCTLQAAGMITDVVTDPAHLLTHLADFRPDLVLMDMYLPGCTGAELASVIRQFENYVTLPIVFLSAERDTSKQLAAMKVGGDDFLTKPISPQHLVSAVSARLHRYRVLRSYVLQDSLTGLLNHATTKERWLIEITRAARERKPVCFVMVDMDHFKSINDTHGHPVGDRVLKSLADLLKQRLRKTDIIGRIGGEEFAAILPNTRAAEAVRLLDELRQAFSQVRQHAESGQFTATFSCGIAQYQLGASADEVCALADRALYQAKQTGRNRVATSAAPAPSQGLALAR